MNLRLPLLSFVALFHCSLALADTSIAIDLSGTELKDAAKVTLVSSASLNPSTQYIYEFSGTVQGTGDFATLIPAGTPLADALDDLNAESFSLEGTKLQATPTLPVTILSKSLKGAVFLEGKTFRLKAAVTAIAGASGVVTLKFRDVSVTSQRPGRLKKPNASTILFEAGSTLTIAVAAATSIDPLPDFILKGGVGNDVYESSPSIQQISLRSPVNVPISATFFVQNDSTTTKTYSLNLPSDPFNQATFKYFIDDEDVSGSSSITLDSLEFVKIKVKATAKPSSPFFDSVDVMATVSSGAVVDRIRIGVQRR